MFNQVEIWPQDRDYHRFLWKGKDHRWTRLVFGDKLSPDLAITAIRFLADRKREELPLGAEALKRATYMDDVLISSEKEATRDETTRQVDEILAQGSFTIKGWTLCPPKESAGEPEDTSVLRTMWDRRTRPDAMYIRPVVLVPEWPMTKRKIL